MAGITIRGLSKSFGANARSRGRHRPRSRHQGQFLRHAARPVRLRQDHDAAPDRRLHHARPRHDRGRRPRACRRRGAVVPPEARGMGMVFQNYAVWPHKTVFENVVFGLKLRKVPAAEARKKVAETLALVNLAGLGSALSERAVRRPAAARRARALAGGRARHPAARRAAVQSRRQAARAHAHRAQGIAAAHRHHLRLRHPRPGRGAGAVRPDRGDERRPAAAIRHAVRGLCPSGQPHGGRLHGPGEPGAGHGARVRNGARHRRARRRSHARCRRARWAFAPATASTSRSGRRTSACAPRPAPPAAASPRSPTTSSSAISASITRRCRPARCCGCRPIRCEQFKVGDEVAIEIDATQCSVFRRGGRASYAAILRSRSAGLIDQRVGGAGDDVAAVRRRASRPAPAVPRPTLD